MTLLSELFPDGSSGGLRRGARISLTTSTTLQVADHVALAPAGYGLWGWDVICIGAGGSGMRYFGGSGGGREQRFVPVAEVGTSVAVVVGAGGVAVSHSIGSPGGDTSFGVSLGASGGGAGLGSAAVDGIFPARTSKRPLVDVGPSSATAWANYQTGAPGTSATATVPTNVFDGSRGGGGGVGPSQAGGSVWPHPSAMSTVRAAGGGFGGVDGGAPASAAQLALVRVRADVATAGPGNPSTTPGAAGHPGVGDYPGGGGNGNAGSAGNVAGDGGFPGGGGGGSNGSSGTQGNGADGVVYLYPIFEPL
ncbi:hypothetical protein KABACHOK_00890 [Brevundimonas phage vB_BpoS-Kabachok]|uniref:Minor tail protein n=1 Tax=Brevundimonas phage vB_BpoS-Kabachok TaxID=2948600 RepID=A0A9E7MPT7_9CAUD|nr:hypothetical protein KABACHOK_00890 [Brevundimonas phage vB_BpoS-Kabachok]